MLQVGLSEIRLQQACAAAAASKYILHVSGNGSVHVVIARDAQDLDVLEAYAASLLAAGHVSVSVRNQKAFHLLRVPPSFSIWCVMHQCSCDSSLCSTLP